MIQKIYVLLLCLSTCIIEAQPQHLGLDCQALTDTSNLSEKMVDGIHQFLLATMRQTATDRTQMWTDGMRPERGADNFLAIKRKALIELLGIRGARESPNMQIVHSLEKKIDQRNKLAVEINHVRWQVKGDLISEGLLVTPREGAIKSTIIMIPDADIPPEILAGLAPHHWSWHGLARQMASEGHQIVIPALINRDTTYSGSEILDKHTNQPHREWLYKQGYELGRHFIGDEVEKIRGAIDYFAQSVENSQPIRIMGYGEGGLIAMLTGALDTRVEATLVSGYFNSWEDTYKEPIYRNIFSVLKNFGAAELATMHWPRKIIIEHSRFPQVDNPRHVSPWQTAASPGIIQTPDLSAVEKEFNKISQYTSHLLKHAYLINATADQHQPFSHGALGLLLEEEFIPENSSTLLQTTSDKKNINDRQKRLVKNLENIYQKEITITELNRKEHFWKKIDTEENSQEIFQTKLWEVLGRLPAPTEKSTPKARLVDQTEKWIRYEVVLDVYPGVFAWGLLTIPTDTRKGDQLPVVVCQHGLEGLPKDVVTTDTTDPKFRPYQGFATSLAEQGFITFAPHNPYRGGDRFRILQRIANPLGHSLFSIIIAQHQVILDWLQGLPFVDAERIGFYGLSYGGKSAMRIPAVLDGYALSICSGDFNEWIRKNVSTSLPYSYMFYGEYEMPEWNLGRTYNYAEMAALIAPRPFMIEFGYYDGIGSSDWVNYEFGKVRRYYDLNGWQDRLDKEFFAGPHQIHGVGTFEFLKKHLQPSKR